MNEKIASLQNPKIKQARKLRKAGQRKKEDLIIIEGCEEIAMALAAGINIVSVFYAPAFAKGKELPAPIKKDLVLTVAEPIFKKISYRENPDGFLAIAKPRELKLEKVMLSNSPLIVVLEAVEKPGNLGAILRSTDAAGAEAVLLCDPTTDIYNPNVIRSSLGTVFTNQVVTCTNEEAYEWLRKNGIKSYAATARTNYFYTKVDYRQAVAIIIGTEHTGLSQFWRQAADQQVKIPMRGKINSLNASVSTAIILFEAVRQRKSAG